MAITRDQIIAEIRSWEGTAFHYQQRVKGVGVDCLGHLVAVAKNVGIIDLDFRDYGKRPDARQIKERLAALEASGLIRKLRRDEPLLPADFLYLTTFTDPPQPWHFAWVDELDGVLMIAHAFCSKRKRDARVICQTLTRVIRGKIIDAYRLRGLE
jgi:hypothetical protein